MFLREFIKHGLIGMWGFAVLFGLLVAVVAATMGLLGLFSLMIEHLGLLWSFATIIFGMFVIDFVLGGLSKARY